MLSMFRKIELSDAKVKISELESEVRRWKTNYERLDARYTAMTAKDATEAHHLCDFEAMQAFSIERNPYSGSEGNPVTNIGYTIVDSQGGAHVKEWIMYTTLEQHNKLVEEFNKYVKGKR